MCVILVITLIVSDIQKLLEISPAEIVQFVPSVVKALYVKVNEFRLVGVEREQDKLSVETITRIHCLPPKFMTAVLAVTE